MTTEPFYETRILEMPIEKYAEIAIDGGIWLLGELLDSRRWANQDLSIESDFVPDPLTIHRPRHLETVIFALGWINEDLRHRIFAVGFLKMPDNGAQATFQRLLVTHTEMLNDAFRMEWNRRTGSMSDVSNRRFVAGTVANELLHKLTPPR